MCPSGAPCSTIPTTRTIPCFGTRGKTGILGRTSTVPCRRATTPGFQVHPIFPSHFPSRLSHPYNTQRFCNVKWVHVVWLRRTTNSSETLNVNVHHSVVRANPLRKYFNLTATNPTPYNRMACYSVLLRVSYCPHRLPAHLHEDAAGAFPASGDHEHGHQKRDFVATSAGQRPHVQPLTARGLCSCFHADYGS